MSPQERVPMIDALRGLSCLAILLYHVRVDLWIGWWRITSYPGEYSFFAKTMAWLSIPTPFLGYAIILFFLISGFCIHFPNTLESSKPKWRQYFMRRFWRIYPPYLAALTLTAGVSYFCHVNWNDPDWDPERILRTATLSQNYPPGNGQFLSNPSLWTIPLEVEFYLLYPLAFCLFSRLRSRLLAPLAVALFAWTVSLGDEGVLWPSFTALFFWPTWLLGAWVAQLHRENRLRSTPPVFSILIGSLFLVLALASHKKLQDWQVWIQYSLWTGFYLSLLLFSLRKWNPINSQLLKAVLSLLSWLGKISFSLYLVHFPLFKLIGYLHVARFGEKPANFLLSLVYLALVCLFGWFFYHWIERPIHLWSKNRLQKS